MRELWVAEGAHGLDDLLRSAAAATLPVQRVSRAQLDRMASDHQGVVARLAPRVGASLDGLLRAGPNLLVALAGIEDPHNLGAVARSAEAAGAEGLIVPQRRSAPVSAAAQRAAAGALEYLPVAHVVNLNRALEACKRAGLWACAADPEAAQLSWEVDLTVPLVVVIGSEGHGLPRLVRDRCDMRVRLPMAGRTRSLNASVAAGVLLYEVLRQRSATQSQRARVDGARTLRL